MHINYDFRWDEWNTEHIGEHDVTPTEAEYIVNHARPPYPQRHRKKKQLVVGQLWDGTYLQVIYVVKSNGDIYVIHSRPLTDAEKRIFRRRKK